MIFSSNRGLIKPLISFLDSKNKAFCYSNFELTLTFEELSGLKVLSRGLKKKL